MPPGGSRPPPRGAGRSSPPRHRPVEDVEARSVLAQKAVDPCEEVLAGLRGERAHRLVAEDRLEHLLTTADVPPATTTSAPVNPPVWANTASMTVRPAPLTPSEASRAVARFDRLPL